MPALWLAAALAGCGPDEPRAGGGPRPSATPPAPGGKAPSPPLATVTASGKALAPALRSLERPLVPRGALLSRQDLAVQDGDALITAIVGDGAGGHLVAGYFHGRLDPGAGDPLVSAGGWDVFVLGYDAEGALRFATRLGGAGDDLGVLEPAVGPGGRIYLTGAFTGESRLGDVTLVSGGDEDLFVVALDADGRVLWARGYGDAGKQRGGKVAVDPGTGDLVLTGYVGSGALDLGGGPLSAEGTCGNILARLGPDGEHRWSRIFRGFPSDWGSAVVVDDDGGILLVGQAEQTVNLGQGPLPGAPDPDLLVARFDAAGELVWARRTADFGPQVPAALALDRERGELVVVGNFTGKLTWGEVELRSAGGPDGFLLRVGPDDGALRSALRFGGEGDDGVMGMALAPDGDVVVSGWFDRTFRHGTTRLVPEGAHDGYVLRFTPAGEPVWGQAVGAAGEEWIQGIMVDTAGRVVAGTGTVGSDVSLLLYAP